MNKVFEQNIISTYLKFDSISKTLSTKILDNAVLRIVLQQYNLKQNPISLANIRDLVNTSLGANMGDDRIRESLIRQNVRIANAGNNRYVITGSALDEMNQCVQDSTRLHDKIITKYFQGSTLDYEKKLLWFRFVLTEFLMQYFSEFALNGSFSKSKKKYVDSIENIITKSFENLNEISIQEKSYLRRGFSLFFEDRSDVDNNRLFYQYGVTCFAAQVFKAHNFADSYSVEQYRDMTFVLDTNVLFTINLEDKLTANQWKSLEQALLKLNNTLIYLKCTGEEYNRVATTSYNFLKSRVAHLREIDVPTQISQAAEAYHCHDIESLNNFYEMHINTIPKVLCESMQINFIDNKEIDSIIKNEKLTKSAGDKYREILDIYHSHKQGQKFEHDVQLLTYANEVNQKGGKLTILTNDRTLQTYATQNPVYNNLPLAIGIDTLIALFSIDNAGIGGDDNYEYIFKQLVQLNFVVFDDNDIRESDFYTIHVLQNRISSLTPDKREQIQQEVLNMRARNESVDSIQLYLQRELNIEVKNQNRVIDQYAEENEDLKKQIEAMRPTIDYVRRKEFNSILICRKAVRIAIFVSAFLLLAGGIGTFVYDMFISTENLNWYKIVCEGLAFLGGLCIKLTNLVDRIGSLSINEKDIEKEIDKRIGNNQ